MSYKTGDKIIIKKDHTNYHLLYFLFHRYAKAQEIVSILLDSSTVDVLSKAKNELFGTIEILYPGLKNRAYCINLLGLVKDPGIEKDLEPTEIQLLVFAKR